MKISQAVEESKAEKSEAVSQSGGEYEPNPNSELNSKPIQESDESVDYTADDIAQAQINEENLPLETSIVNSVKENSNDDLTAIREGNFLIRLNI